jgi:hypothetical protein
MQIHFARYEAKSKRYLYGYWVAIVIGGLAAISSNPDGFGIAQVLLAAAFLALALYASGVISDDYGNGAFLKQEISGDEYMALNSRLQMYPELREQLREHMPEDNHISYSQAFEIERIVNQHAQGARVAQDEDAREHNRKQLLKTIGSGSMKG